jgi:hypothetical protein
MVRPKLKWIHAPMTEAERASANALCRELFDDYDRKHHIMSIPDQIDLDLATLKAPENLDRLEQIQRLLRQVLYSEEITSGPDPDGDHVMDTHWVADLGKITMQKAPESTLHTGRRGR